MEGGDHYYQTMSHAALEELTPDIVPFVQPVVDLPHLLQLSIRVFHSDSPRELLQRLRHIVRKQQHRPRRLTEPLEQIVHVLKQCRKVSSRSKGLHILLTIPTR